MRVQTKTAEALKAKQEALKAKQEAQDATIRLFEQQESNRLLKRANAQLTAEFSIMKESTRQTEIVASSTLTPGPTRPSFATLTAAAASRQMSRR